MVQDVLAPHHLQQHLVELPVPLVHLVLRLAVAADSCLSLPQLLHSLLLPLLLWLTLTPPLLHNVVSLQEHNFWHHLLRLSSYSQYLHL